MYKPSSFLAVFAFSWQMLTAQSDFPFGVRFDDENYQKIPIRSKNDIRAGQRALPNQVSLQQFAPRAGEQEKYSTCLAWSIAYALTIQEAKARQYQAKTDAAAIQKLFYSPGYIYHHIKDSNDLSCNAGAEFLKASEALQRSGVMRYTDFKETCPAEISEGMKKRIFQGIVPEFHRLFGTEEGDKVAIIKEALAGGNPVIAAIQGSVTGASFGELKGNLLSFNPAAATMGHAMCVVGYDDNIYGGAFLLLNSLGTGWGESGYCWINYRVFNKHIRYAIEIPPLLHLPVELSPNLPTATVQEVKPFHSTIRFVDMQGAKVDLKNAATEIRSSKRGAGVTKKTQACHFIAAKPVKEGDSYQILVDNNESAYVYILNFDSRKVVDILFPHHAGISPYLGKGALITLPSEQDMITFDDNKGTDYCCILWSRTPLNIQDLRQKIENEAKRTPLFVSCVETVLGKDLTGAKNSMIKYQAQEGQLILSMNTQQNIAMMIIEFEHK